MQVLYSLHALNYSRFHQLPDEMLALTVLCVNSHWAYSSCRIKKQTPILQFLWVLCKSKKENNKEEEKTTIIKQRTQLLSPPPKCTNKKLEPCFSASKYLHFALSHPPPPPHPHPLVFLNKTAIIKSVYSIKKILTELLTNQPTNQPTNQAIK